MRPIALVKLLNSVAFQSVYPNEIIIVDGSSSIAILSCTVLDVVWRFEFQINFWWHFCVHEANLHDRKLEPSLSVARRRRTVRNEGEGGAVGRELRKAMWKALLYSRVFACLVFPIIGCLRFRFWNFLLQIECLRNLVKKINRIKTVFFIRFISWDRIPCDFPFFLSRRKKWKWRF